MITHSHSRTVNLGELLNALKPLRRGGRRLRRRVRNGAESGPTTAKSSETDNIGSLPPRHRLGGNGRADHRFGRRDHSRPEMAPQPLEKIKSAPGNGMVSEASNPQHLVSRRAADRSAPADEPRELQNCARATPKLPCGQLESAGGGCPMQFPPRIDADRAAAGGQARKFSVLQSLENTQNREGISISRAPRPDLPYSFTQAPFAFEDFTAASTKARPFTPSSMVGKCTPSGGFWPERAALIASATSL